MSKCLAASAERDRFFRDWRKYGFSLVAGSRLTNDALIAVSVAGRGFTVHTKNPGDFALIAEFRPFDRQQI
ncbi:MAG: hypothetical protein KF868_20795 [Acidobacteria bacterium]|nr:hypothetical protein [Acidobacteriota bacterium]